MSATDATSAPGDDDPLAAGEAGGRVIRGGGLRAAGHVLGVLTGVISAPLVVRHLGVEDFGRYLTVTSIIYIVTGLTEGGLNNVAVRRYATLARGPRRTLLANLVGLRIALVALGSVGAMAFGVIADYPSVVVGGIALGLVGYLVAALQGAYTTGLQADLRLGTLASIDLTRALLTTVLLVVLVVAGAGLTPFYCVSAAVYGVALALTLRVVGRDAPLRPRADRGTWGALLRETVVYAAATALGAVYFQVALVTMSVLSTAYETGLYSIAFRIVDLANGVPWMLAGSVLPVLAHAAANDHARLRYVATRVFEGALLLGGAASLVLILGARFGVELVAGDEAEGAVEVLRLLGVGIVATFVAGPLGFVLLSLRLHADLVRCNAVAFVLAIALSVVLVPREGAVGAGIVTVTLEVVLASLYLLTLQRRHPELRPSFGVVPRAVLAYALGLGTGLALLLVHPVPAALGGAAVYLGALLVLRAVPPEVALAFRERLGRTP